MSSFIIGYDPGGAKANGISYLELDDDYRISGFNTKTVSTCDEALFWLFGEQKLDPALVVGAGIDSLLSWPTVGTFRPMDYFLKQKYPETRLVSSQSIQRMVLWRYKVLSLPIHST